jgi:hypothetical protein
MGALRVIGDVHCNLSDYTGIANKSPYSIQVGDVGFNYKWINKNLDSTRHKIIAGNHDNYLVENGVFIKQTPHFLGDYGVYTVPDFGDIFFIRGGRSIDWFLRTEGRNWFKEEELTYAQGMKALELYQEVKPEIVISHECPTEIIPFVSSMDTYHGEKLHPSFTAHMLQTLFNVHQPKQWFFGHFHINKHIEVNRTNFYCLDELSYMDIERNI